MSHSRGLRVASLAVWGFLLLWGVPSVSAGAPAPGAAKKGACGAMAPGVEALLKPDSLVVFAELSGTAQSPRFLGEVVCQALAQGVPVRVGLLLPMEDQRDLEDFLAAGDVPDGPAAMPRGWFWGSTTRYWKGAASEAMYQLLRRLRELRRSKAPLEVFAYNTLDTPSAERMSTQARKVQAVVDASPGALTLLLSNRVFARTAKGLPTDAEFRSMGWHLAQAKRPMTALRLSHTGGSFWGCLEADVCEVHLIPGTGRGASPFVRLEASPDAEGFHGVFHVGALTASRPAVEEMYRRKKVATEASAAELRARAEAAYKARRYADCGRLYEEASRVESPEQGQDAYNAACCHALGKDTDAAFSMLRWAGDLKHDDWFHMQRDPDLAILRPSPSWRAKLEQVRFNLKHPWVLTGGNPKLVDLMLEEQNDWYGAEEGLPIDEAQVVPRSEKRRAEVLRMLEPGKGKSPSATDYLLATHVFLLGNSVEDARKARELAARAMAMDDEDLDAPMLAATAEDRELKARGKPQRFGTQRHQVEGQWRLYPVDPKTTDAEREKWRLPSLEELKREAEDPSPPASSP
ncbi:hypothetical protein MYSTI_07972 [Myxococcus stipitatus DSM 14675]|uniref:Uncharacterized protein n=1 Tax=Myxococcus stipitatus (strain DSM 14675 / JCM 12634 / Mx s8) TaxID=1278073 RepID=L7URK0_MYXSD|nr:hypothetical protein [Myxococcus stipitatus]AGC49244.1 hypothetical protein MYSTI_07972 [Myxococcus stipitatus DSM 14675]